MKSKEEVRRNDMDEVAKLDNMVISLMKEKDDHLRSINELMQSSSEAQEEIDVLLHEIDRLEGEISTLQNELKFKESRSADVEAELKRLKARLDFQDEDSLEKEKASIFILTSLQTQLLEKEKELIALKMDLEKVKVEFADLEIEKNCIDNERVSVTENLEAIIATLQSRLAESVSQRRDVTLSATVHGDSETLTAECATSCDQSVLMSNDCTHISSKLEDNQMELLRFHMQLSETMASFSSLNSKMELYGNWLVDVVNGINSSLREINIESADIPPSVSLCGKTNEEIFDEGFRLLRVSVSVLFSSLCAKDIQLSLMKEDNANMQREFFSQQMNLSRSLEENLKQTQQILSLQDSLQKENDKVKANTADYLELQDLKFALSSSNQEIDNLKELLARSKSELHDIQNILSSSNHDINNLKAQLHSCECENKYFRNTADSLEMEKTHLITSYEEKYSQMAAMILHQEKQLKEKEKAQRNFSHREADLLRAQSESSAVIFDYQNKISSLQDRKSVV